MKLIFLNGGLANQVFQYIFYRNATLLHPEEDWFLDDSFFYTEKIHNGYELKKVFGLQPKLLSACFDADVWAYMCARKRDEGKSIPQQLLENGIPLSMAAGEANYTHWNPFDGNFIPVRESEEYQPEILSVPGDVYYHGYWINHGYFYAYEDLFRKELQFPPVTEAYNTAYLSQIRNTNSASVHIRRGDYVTLGFAPSDADYHTMIGWLLEAVPNASLFVFSDDLAYCKEHADAMGIPRAKEVVFVEGNKGENAFRDMQLMSQCKNMIINNSAFCYLAGLLNTDLHTIVNPSKRVILPKEET